MCAVYNVLKDFAGPVATVIAAGAATWITWRLPVLEFGRRSERKKFGKIPLKLICLSF
jgi:hypothetical protein